MTQFIQVCAKALLLEVEKVIHYKDAPPERNISVHNEKQNTKLNSNMHMHLKCQTSETKHVQIKRMAL